MSSIQLRDACWSDLPRMAHILALAFWDDNVVGDIIHPHRQEFPEDFDAYWLRRLHCAFWDYRTRLLVAVDREEDSGKEVVVGVSRWTRMGPGGKDMECWRFDPRNLMKPLSIWAMDIHALIWPNRASDPSKADILARAFSFYRHVFSGERADSWYLWSLAVDPAAQGKGVGRELVQWGLRRAEVEGVCASVGSAKGKDGFYLKCGFEIQDGNICEGEGNPLAGLDCGNIYWTIPKKKL
ncbi:acyl-CoA N-acyltransferase [Xylariales sp. PMI_506]|nr:acyl-CoA N-acyltransferase [Xylariales sp. PMI_506]